MTTEAKLRLIDFDSLQQAAECLRTLGHPVRLRMVHFKNMSQERGSTKMEIFFALGFVVLWIALQAWILPRFGVST